MDTANDFRINIAEDAIKRLEKRIRQWNLPWPINKNKALDHVNNVRKALLKLKYSYLPLDILLESEELRSIINNSKELAGQILRNTVSKLDVKKQLALAEIKYSLSILIGLPGRLKLGEQNYPEYAVDVVGVEVTRIEKLQSAERLYYTRAAAGRIVLTIITNISDIKLNEIRAAAILPPVEFMGVISEAMYSSEPLDRKYLGKRVPRKYLLPELKAHIIRLVSGK